MKLRRRSSPQADVPTASMPDVAFLLVIFFMITATFTATRGLDLNLPAQQRPDGPEIAHQDAVQLHVFADHAQLDCSPVEVNEVAGRLRSILSRNPDQPVVLVVEPDVAYKRMVAVYDELLGLRKNGFLDEIYMPMRQDRELYTRIFGEDPFLARCRG